MEKKHYIDFPNTQKGREERKKFWLSEDGLILISQWRREGIGIDEIALKYIGVTTRTLRNWRTESEAMAQALLVSGDICDSMVESALFKRALGFHYEENIYELVEGQMMKVRTVEKYSPPDTKACLSWLFSRRPDRWHATQPDATTQKEIDDVKKVLVAMKEVATEEEKKEISLEE